MTYNLVYVDCKPDGTPFYVGKGDVHRAQRKSRKNKLHTNICKKYPNWTRGIAFAGTVEDCLKKEIELIKQFGRRNIGTGSLVNFTDGGEGTIGYVFTEEHKKKIGDAHRGQKSWAFGKSLAQETKQKISETKLNKNLKGNKCPNFKVPVLATNIKTQQSIVLYGTAEMRKAGFQDSNIFKCLSGKRKTHKGHTFTRLEI